MSDPLRERFSTRSSEALEHVRLVAFHGELDYADAAAAGEALRAALTGDRTRMLIVDLGALDFIDSSGINEIVAIAKAAKALGRELVVAAPNDNVARVFEIVRLGDVVRIEPSVAVALLQFRVD